MASEARRTMVVFEGADVQLAEATRLYRLLDHAVRTWFFQGAAERLLAKADELYALAARSVSRAEGRAEPAHWGRIERLRYDALAARERLEKRALHRVMLLKIDAGQRGLGQLLDYLFALGVPNPLERDRRVGFRVLVVLSTLVLCVGTPLLPLGLGLIFPPVLMGWTLFAAAVIGPGLAPRGPARTGITVVGVGVLALFVALLSTVLWLPSLVPLGLSLVGWPIDSLRRHFS